MRLSIGKYKNHGWHVGRPFKYFGILVLGVVTLPMGLLIAGLVEYSGLPGLPLIYGPSILLGLLGLKSLVPKLRGEAIPYCPPFKFMHESGDQFDDPLLTVTSTSHPKTWRVLTFCDFAIWVLAAGGQLWFLSLA